MHNIKDIRNDFENFKEKLKNRNIDINLDNILSLIPNLPIKDVPHGKDEKK